MRNHVVAHAHAMTVLNGCTHTAFHASHLGRLVQGKSQCYDKDLQTSFYLFKLGVLILES